MRVLVIDDEESVRSLVSEFLRISGYEPVVAENGEVGIEMARKHRPDIILCDINMPKMDGYGVLRSLHSDASLSTIPFLFLTARGEREDQRMGMDLGADDYLIKPFRKSELLRAVQTRLAKKEALTRHYEAEVKAAREKLDYYLHFDNLTGLPNRLTLRERFNEAALQMPPDGKVAILSLGLDRFKRINETLGHHAGDALLKMVAERLSHCIGSDESVARLSADQFAMMLLRPTDSRQAEQVAQMVLSKLLDPFRIGDYNIFTTASIGIALFPNDGEHVDALIRNALIAMHAARKQGGNNFLFYRPDIQVQSPERLSLESGLRYAIESDQLTVHYQPQVSLLNGQIVGAEALVRWRHPERGMIPPAQFIPLAEESGLIEMISEFVLQTATSQTRKWQEAGFPSFSLGVNLSGHHFSQQNICDRLVDILRGTSLEPGYLSIELTESVLMEDVPSAIATLHEMKRLGIQISIDDFGTGYSSLSYLKRFPFDTLKIDQSFIRNVSEDSKNAAICMAVIQMAHNLELNVVAEGVETLGELEFLAQNKCDIMQGYYFSRPLPPDEFESLLLSAKRMPLPGEL